MPGEAALRLQVGGTLVPGRDIYIARPEDEQLFELLSSGEYVNILSSRQVGKSSLMVRTALRLREQGFRFADVDLTTLGTPASARGYFRGLVVAIARKLKLQFDAEDFWREDATTGTDTQQFIRFFREVVAAEIDGPVLIFLDEIDSTLKLPFTDDLFTALRSMYNERAMVPAYRRIGFCLVGVATPDELIKDRRTTPYNVGETLSLGDFNATRDDLTPLINVLSEDAKLGSELLRRVLYWTGGHPWLTTRLCKDLRADSVATADGIDRFVTERYATLESLGENVHIQQILRFVRERLTDGLASLDLYEHILKGDRKNDQVSLAHAELKLSGLVKRDANGILVPRNRIYERLFNLEWVQKSRPKRALRKARGIAYGAAALLLVVMVGGLFFYQTDVAPKQAQLQARETLEKLGVTLQKDYRGWTNVVMSGKDADKDPQSVLQRAAPELAILGKERESAGLYLDLSSLAIKDLSPLAAITGLRRLDVSATKITDLTPLAKLTDLQELDLSGTLVADLAPLANLVGLRQLSVARTAVEDLAPLSGLIGLQQLDASATRIADLSPLTHLNALQQLDVSYTPIENLNPLARLASLQELNLSKTQVKVLAPLNALQNLHTLILEGLDITNFDAVKHLPDLNKLRGEQPNSRLGALKPGQTFRDCAQCPDMVVVPAGRFTMGSPQDEAGRFEKESPEHSVALARPFAMAKFEVRFDEWTACVQDQGCRAPQDEGYGRGARPVINVSWDDAKRYVAWLTQKSGKPYRLLTEAEWEYAARAGSKGAHFWDATSTNACAFANVLNPTVKEKYKLDWASFDCEDGYVATAPSGSFKPNAFGLYDMLGNVWEWVEDCYHESYEGAPTDGAAWTTGECSSRVIRGGGWNNKPQFVRSAIRNRITPGNRVNNLGFRVARTLTP